MTEVDDPIIAEFQADNGIVEGQLSDRFNSTNSGSGYYWLHSDRVIPIVPLSRVLQSFRTRGRESTSRASDAPQGAKFTLGDVGGRQRSALQAPGPALDQHVTAHRSETGPGSGFIDAYGFSAAEESQG